jgi:hypothetical protein
LKAEEQPSTGCCPPFDPTPWQDQEISWHNKPFVKDHVACLFHVPLKRGAIVLKGMALIDAAPVQPMMLSDETLAVGCRSVHRGQEAGAWRELGRNLRHFPSGP